MTKKELIQDIIGTKELMNHLIKINSAKISNNKELQHNIKHQISEWNELVNPVIKSKGLNENKAKYEDARTIANNIYKQVNWLLNTKFNKELKNNAIRWNI